MAEGVNEFRGVMFTVEISRYPPYLAKYDSPYVPFLLDVHIRSFQMGTNILLYSPAPFSPHVSQLQGHGYV